MANPVPPLPDADRLTEYNPVTATVGPFDVGFAIYGTGTDYQSWIEVWLDGVLLTPVTHWVLTSPFGADLSVLARPLTDARITFTSARAGQIIIVGAQRPRRTSQAAEGIGIPARDHNRIVTELMAIAREHNEKLGRAVVALPGDDIVSLEDIYDYAGGALPAAQEARADAIAAAEAAEGYALISQSLSGGVAVFPTKAAAEDHPFAGTLPQSIELRSVDVGAVGSTQGVYEDRGTTPAHDLKVTIGAKTYELLPASVETPVNIYQLGGVHYSNGTEAFNRLLAAWLESGYGNWVLPPNGLIFPAKPNDIDSPDQRFFRLRGMSRYRSELQKAFPSSGASEGILNVRQNDVHISDISFVGLTGSQISPGSGVGTGTSLSLVSRTGRSIGYGTFENLHFTSDVTSGGSCVQYNAYFDGAISAGPTGFGARGLVASNWIGFGAGGGAFLFNNCIGISLEGGATFQAGGGTGRILLLSQLPSGEQQGGCDGVRIDLSEVDGGVLFDHGSRGCLVSSGHFGRGELSFASGAQGCHTMGWRRFGCVVNNASTTCSHHDSAPISGWAMPTGTLSRSALGTYEAPTAGGSYSQAQVQAVMDAVQAWSRTTAALITDLGGPNSSRRTLGP